jgi:hypothetical protein
VSDTRRLRELEGVRLRVDIPERGLRTGDIGTIVLVFERPNLAYEVEFVDQDGRTRAQLPLLPEQVGPMNP